MEGKVLAGRIVIVTGASSGIGYSICEVLAEAGAHVVMAARRVERLQELQKSIETKGGKAIYHKTDVSLRQDVKDLVKFAESKYGPVDVLVNNAGVFSYSLMKNLFEDEWDKVIDVNCKGLMNGIGAVVTGMVERKKGHIVNISSDNGRKGFPGMAAYTGSKFFMEGVTRVLRQEVAADGVKVTSIQPGETDSEIFDHCSKDQEVLDKFGSLVPRCKILSGEDIARAVLYVLSQPDHVAINEILIHPKEAPIQF